MIYNYKETTEESIEGIPVAKKINYLGITIQNKKDCFKLQKLESLEKAKKNANIIKDAQGFFKLFIDTF